MFELYNKADKDNTSSTKLVCDIRDENNGRVIEFVQSEYSDFNKWSKSKVLTDIIVTRCFLPEIYSHITSIEKLKKYISSNKDEDFSIINEIKDVAMHNQSIIISMPTSMAPYKRGIPGTNRKYKDTYLPLIVSVDGIDVSKEFMDFGDFNENAVKVAYQALVKGDMPKTNNDIFRIDGVKALHNELFEESVM